MRFRGSWFDSLMKSEWSTEYDEGGKFERFFLSLEGYEQAVVAAAIEHVLEVHGIDICSGSWGKSLGEGLYEFRIGTSLSALLKGSPDYEESPGEDKKVLVRVFCAFQGEKIVLLHHGYNKGKDPSKKRQQKEIKTARKLHKAWKASLKKS